MMKNTPKMTPAQMKQYIADMTEAGFEAGSSDRRGRKKGSRQNLNAALDRVKQMMDGMIKAMETSERQIWETVAVNAFLGGMTAEKAGTAADAFLVEWRKRWTQQAQIHNITALLQGPKKAAPRTKKLPIKRKR